MSIPPSTPSFATPLPQSPRSDILEWRFPKPYSQYVLTGRSRAAWHTSFVIPQLNLLLDAGLVVNRLRPKHIFLTHGHSDHSLLAPAYVKREDPPDVFCPVEVVRVLDDFMLARTMLNLGGLIKREDAREAGVLKDEENGEETNKEEEEEEEEEGVVKYTPSEKAWLNTHHTHGLHHGDTVPLRRLKGITATAFTCDHTVPCLGYVFSTTTSRLRPDFAALPPSELQALRLGGTALSEPYTRPIFAFLGDTTGATLASDPAWLREGIPVVITECSFLYEEHRAQAEKTKHTIWGDLEGVVRRWPATTFVLTHFSMRYSEKAIATFFRDLPDCPSNIVVWADEEA